MRDCLYKSCETTQEGKVPVSNTLKWPNPNLESLETLYNRYTKHFKSKDSIDIREDMKMVRKQSCHNTYDSACKELEFCLRTSTDGTSPQVFAAFVDPRQQTDGSFRLTVVMKYHQTLDNLWNLAQLHQLPHLEQKMKDLFTKVANHGLLQLDCNPLNFLLEGEVEEGNDWHVKMIDFDPDYVFEVPEVSVDDRVHLMMLLFKHQKLIMRNKSSEGDIQNARENVEACLHTTFSTLPIKDTVRDRILPSNESAVANKKQKT